MQRVASVFLSVLLLVGFRMAAAAPQETAPPQELVRFVRESQNSGLKDAEIEKMAVNAGWKPQTIREVFASIAANPQSPPPVRPPAPAVAPAAKGASTPAANHPPAGAPSTTPAAAPSTTPAGGPPPDGNLKLPDDYQIGAGDSLRIDVWKEPEASVASTIVLPDGTISMPLIKQVHVAGLTRREAEKAITGQLTASGSLIAPDVTVIVAGTNSKKIYVTGKVRKEGPLPYTYRMTIMQALSEAGGINEYAKKKKIYVLHNEDGREFQIPFDYDAVLKGKHMELNILLTAGDTIVVP